MKKYRLESMKPYKLKGKRIRIWRWLKSPFRCKKGYHIPDWENYGFAPGDNVIDMRCDLCENRIVIAIDDLDTAGFQKFNKLLSYLREV